MLSICVPSLISATYCRRPGYQFAVQKACDFIHVLQLAGSDIIFIVYVFSVAAWLGISTPEEYFADIDPEQAAGERARDPRRVQTLTIAASLIFQILLRSATLARSAFAKFPNLANPRHVMQHRRLQLDKGPKQWVDKFTFARRLRERDPR